jgi:hypothetical protein
MDAVLRLRTAVSALSLLASAASIIALLWVWQWAVTNNSSADYEHQHLLQSAFIACLLIAAPLLFVRLLAGDSQSAALAVIGGAAAGAFVAVISSVAATMLVMWVFHSHGAVPEGSDRTTFEIAYVSAATLSLLLGSAAAFMAASGKGAHRIVAVAMAILIVSVAWGYLAVGSSELNKCVVKIDFPLDSRLHGCSGE